MNTKIQYTSNEHREQIISENMNLFLIEEQNIVDGNFLIFTDVKPEPVVVYTQVNAIEFDELKISLSQAKADNLITLEALAEVYEMMLAMQA